MAAGNRRKSSGAGRSAGAFAAANLRYIIAAALAVCVIVTLAVVLIIRPGRKEKQQEVQETADTSLEVPDVPLELNAYPEVVDLMHRYYQACVDGDTQVLQECVPGLTETELMRAGATAEYLEAYPVIDVYSKPGPAEGSYVCYVYSRAKFYDYDKEIPGMKAMYVCTDENGSVYISRDMDSEKVQSYINEISLEEDVIDLNNKVNVEYRELLNSDPELSSFMTTLANDINISVGTQLAIANGVTEVEVPEEEAAEEVPAEEETAEKKRVVEPKEQVNVRAEASTDSAIRGRIDPGSTYELLEEMDGGWCRIQYGAQDGFVKSEYLTITEVTEGGEEAAAEGEETAEGEGTAEGAAATADGRTGTAVVTEGVKIRKSASTDADSIATVYPGQELSVTATDENAGWSRVEYNGQTGYVRTEYLSFR